MLILGIHGASRLDHEDAPEGFARHDAAAVLLRDGELVAAVEDERLNRVKHSNAFPREAVAWCLREAGLDPGDPHSFAAIDALALNVSELAAEFMALRASGDPRRPLRSAQQHFAAPLSAAFGLDLDLVAPKLRFVHHHLAHAWSAWIPSGFDEALVVTLDGEGDGLSGMVLEAREGRLEVRERLSAGRSLGHWYRRMMAFCGYFRFDEYKVMGMAPYGDPERFAALMDSMVSLEPEGRFSFLGKDSLDASAALELRVLREQGLLAQARKRGEPFEDIHRDFAAALQRQLERIVLHLLGHHREASGLSRLCLAGGVAHNCSMNGRLFYSDLFDDLYVQPLAHDAGGALGAAFAVADLRPDAGVLTGLDLGPAVESGEDLDAVLARYAALVEVESPPALEARAADLLAAGEVVAWVRGRAEFGPRALGQRSILADPRPAENRDRINALIKKREGYRPFAPSVLEERCAELFDVPPERARHPYMITVLRVREEQRARLGAITHVDGTARVQTVSAADNPRYHALIREFAERTGVPALLNTSLNNNAEPIVTSAEDALATLLTTDLRYLAIGERLVHKRERSAQDIALALAPALDRQHKLVRRELPCAAEAEAETGAGGWAQVWRIESAASDFFGEAAVEISDALHELLLRADGRRSLAALIDESPHAARRQQLAEEVFSLWSRRVLRMRGPA
ncbi:nodulation protein [Pseudenhygromyxa sp. WMMC2535]|uniref:carbamoyltransferase family protein n=1 Tax=Pseudenhygromyxa sp. WMMC2535 TaxID=2712867 RepID=UPI001553DF69|nr:carbamoyltransferase C-terminal domain-containing protein [Pseudenhygromyxa sp. WMMC2535]NVB40164.1 nodulation protein [Pseudenhygromyxa sp. WMMC2535]